MRVGDMVRFKSPVNAQDLQYMRGRRPDPPWRLGVLIECNSWEKIATILHEGKLIRCRTEHVQKAGKKDGLTNECR